MILIHFVGAVAENPTSL